MKTDQSGVVTRLLLLSMGIWAIALTLELLQNWGGEPMGAGFYNPTMIAEEVLEMIGATLVVLAGLKSSPPRRILAGAKAV